MTQPFAAMAKGFDHRLDIEVARKEDLRFTCPEDAELFATAQYMAYYVPHAVLPEEGDMYSVKEAVLPPPAAVFYINSMPGEG